MSCNDIKICIFYEYAFWLALRLLMRFVSMFCDCPSPLSSNINIAHVYGPCANLNDKLR